MTRSAQFAIGAWEQGSRRRRKIAAIDRFADGALAAGGLLIANATCGLGLGLPGGRAGISAGASAVCAGLAWMSRKKRARIAARRVAHVQPAPIMRHAA